MRKSGDREVKRAILVWAFGEGFPENVIFKLRLTGQTTVTQTELTGNTKLLRQDGACQSPPGSKN